MNIDAKIPNKILPSRIQHCFLIYFIGYAVTLVPFFSSLYSPPPCTPLPSAFPAPQFMSMVIHISSLASTFPILFLTSLCLFCAYHLCFLFPVPFSPFSTLPLPADNPPCDLHFSDSVPVLVVFVFVFFRFSC